MRLPDVNVLLYAADRNSPHHERTAPYVESMLGGRETAALAIEHGAELVSADRDFARFSGLRWHDPLH